MSSPAPERLLEPVSAAPDGALDLLPRLRDALSGTGPALLPHPAGRPAGWGSRAGPVPLRASRSRGSRSRAPSGAADTGSSRRSGAGEDTGKA